MSTPTPTTTTTLTPTVTNTATPSPTPNLVSLLIWDVTGTTGTSSGSIPTAYNAGISGSALISNSGLTTGNAISPNNTWNRTYPNNYTNAIDSINNNQYIEWSTTVEAGYSARIIGFTGFNLAKYVGTSSTCSAALYYSTDGVNFAQTGSTFTVTATLSSAASAFSGELNINPLIVSDATIIWRLVAFDNVDRLGIGNTGTNNIAIYGTIESIDVTTTPTPTSTATPSATSTATPSATSTATPSATSTATPSATSTATPSATSTATPSATSTATPSATSTATPSATSTATPSATSTATPSATSTTTPTLTPSATSIPSIYCCNFIDIYWNNTISGLYTLNNNIYYLDNDINASAIIYYSNINEQWELRYNGNLYYYNPTLNITDTWYDAINEASSPWYVSTQPCVTPTVTPTPSITPSQFPDVTFVGNTPTPTPTQTPTPSSAGYYGGLCGTRYVGYFDEDPSWFLTATAHGDVNNLSSIENFTSSILTDQDYYSWEWFGYFKPSSTENYTFYTSSDDGSYLWIGENALSGYTTSNCLVNNGGAHGTQEAQGTTVNPLTSGVYYPIRIQFGEIGGGDILTVSFSSDTISKTTNGTGYFFNMNNCPGSTTNKVFLGSTNISSIKLGSNNISKIYLGSNRIF